MNSWKKSIKFGYTVKIKQYAIDIRRFKETPTQQRYVRQYV